jgi:hypothetical protein
MELYLSTILGDGTPTGLPKANPFVPVGSDQDGWGMIDLRPDCTKASGYCLLSQPKRNDQPGMTYLGPDVGLDAPSLAVQTAVSSKLGLNLSGTTLRQIISGLLLQQGAWDGTRWKPLLPMRTPGPDIYHIWLGGQLLYQLVAVQGGAPELSESFNKANNGLGPDQTWTTGGGTWAVRSLKGEITASGTNSWAFVVATLSQINHWVQWTINSGSVANYHNIGVIFRKDPNSGTQTYYDVIAIFDTQKIHLAKFVSGSETTLGSDIAATLNASTDYVLKGQVNGSTLTSYLGGVQQHNLTDTAIAENTHVGITGYSSDGATGVVTGKLWSADVLVKAGGGAPMFSRQGY